MADEKKEPKLTKAERKAKAEAAAAEVREAVGNTETPTETPAADATAAVEAPAPKLRTVKLEDAKALSAQRKTREKRLEYQDMLKSLPAGEAGVIDIPEFKDYVRERIRLTNAAADLSLKLEMKKVNSQLYFWIA